MRKKFTLELCTKSANKRGSKFILFACDYRFALRESVIWLRRYPNGAAHIQPERKRRMMRLGWQKKVCRSRKWALDGYGIVW